MSGKSSCSRLRTSPMDRWERSLTAASGSGRTEEEHQLELPDLQLVAVGEDDLAVDALAVDVGAVERAGVGCRVGLAVAPDLDVTSRHRDVVEEDVAVGMATCRGDLLVEQEP